MSEPKVITITKCNSDLKEGLWVVVDGVQGGGTYEVTKNDKDILVLTKVTPSD